MKRSRRSLSRKLTWACPCVLVLLAQPARANDPEPCAVRLSPPGTAEAWRGAAQRLEQRMRTLTQPSTDCHDISLEVAESQATLTLVTLDGRRAVRAIASPDELVPSAEALLVVPPVVAEEPVAPTRVAAVPAEDNMSLVLTAAGGMRLALPGDYVSPTVGGERRRERRALGPRALGSVGCRTRGPRRAGGTVWAGGLSSRRLPWP